MVKALTLSRMARALTTGELKNCIARQKDPRADDLQEHEEYALSLDSWSVGTEEKLAVLIFEDLLRKEGCEPVVVSGDAIAAFAKAQALIYKVRHLRLRNRS